MPTFFLGFLQKFLLLFTRYFSKDSVWNFFWFLCGFLLQIFFKVTTQILPVIFALIPRRILAGIPVKFPADIPHVILPEFPSKIFPGILPRFVRWIMREYRRVPPEIPAGFFVFRNSTRYSQLPEIPLGSWQFLPGFLPVLIAGCYPNFLPTEFFTGFLLKFNLGYLRNAMANTNNVYSLTSTCFFS